LDFVLNKYLNKNYLYHIFQNKRNSKSNIVALSNIFPELAYNHVTAKTELAVIIAIRIIVFYVLSF